MKYHKYESNKFTDEQVSILRSVKKGSGVINGMLSDSEFKTLENILASHTAWKESGDISNIYGFHWDQEPNDDFKHQQVIKEILEDKIKSIIGDFKLDFLMLQQSLNPWHIHTDWRWNESKLPYMTILIPIAELDLRGNYIDPNNWKDTYTIAFEQSNFGSSSKGNEAFHGNVLHKNSKLVREKLGAENFTDSNTISHNDQQKYFSHHTYESLHGLEIANKLLWKPKAIAFHPQSAFHCASNFHDEGLLQKHSIVIFTLLDQ
jgi:hypothetical protein